MTIAESNLYIARSEVTREGFVIPVLGIFLELKEGIRI